MSNHKKFLNCHSFSDFGNKETLLELGLTIVHPFYNDKERFDLQFWNWMDYDKEIKKNLKIIISDDCSTPPVVEYLTPSKTKRININLEIYRILKDLKWNTPGALNLGILNSSTDWILIMDSDCLLKPSIISQLMKNLKPSKEWFYYFPRNRITNKREKLTRYLPCSVLFHKENFVDIGGFDEDFTGERSGGYGIFDNAFENQITTYGYKKGLLEDIIIDEYMEDFVGPNIQMKTNTTKDHIHINKKIGYDKYEGRRPWNRNFLNFPWERSFKYDIR